MSDWDLRADKRYEFACRNADTGCSGRTPFTHRLCIDCWDEQQRAAWEKYPVVSDWEGMLFSQTKDEYYPDLETAVDHLFDDDCTTDDIDDLQLVVCVPVKPREFSLSDWVVDEAHDDWEIDEKGKEVEQKINELLATITDLSYEPGKTRPDTTKLQEALEAHRAKEKPGDA